MNAHSPRDEQLFAEALEQPPADRGTFLAKACGSDAAMLARIAALVAAHEGPESLMASASPLHRASAPP